ncbi:hypothetical protein KR222_009000 [Zaprionus bogoriensis]|nr:hypothetical protein KR222_009000 [Zaprionus bogoriensis]
MLLDVIIWLPTLFTYILFLLILVILCFIVAYVSHKIYISIYDNLPLPAAPGSRSSFALRDVPRLSEPLASQLSARSIWIPNRSAIFESTTVRITLALEPCYLVSLELDIHNNAQDRAVSFMCNCQREGVTTCAATESRAADGERIVKYYSHMSSIPRLKILLRCNERSNMRLVLDDVIQDVMEARCTDSGAACRRPKLTSKSQLERRDS